MAGGEPPALSDTEDQIGHPKCSSKKGRKNTDSRNDPKLGKPLKLSK